MDIPKKIAELKNELDELTAKQFETHARIKELKSQIGKLQTIAKHAQELFAEPKDELV